MSVRIQRLFGPDGSLQPRTDLLNKTFQGFYRVDKGSTPTFHPHTEIRMANPHITESETQRALGAINPHNGAGINGFFHKTLKT